MGDSKSLTETSFGSRSNFHLNTCGKINYQDTKDNIVAKTIHFNLDVKNVRTYRTITGLFLYLFGFASIVTVNVDDKQKKLYVNKKSFIKHLLRSIFEQSSKNVVDKNKPSENFDENGLVKKILSTIADLHILTAEKTDVIYQYYMNECRPKTIWYL